MTSIGSSNKLIYDVCNYNKRLYESTSPLAYQLYEGKHEHCGKCVANNLFIRPMDLVDYESELRNMTRPLSNCDQYKYNPSCKQNALCTSTFSKNVPVVFTPEICFTGYNNIKKVTYPGVTSPTELICDDDMQYLSDDLNARQQRRKQYKQQEEIVIEEEDDDQEQ